MMQTVASFLVWFCVLGCALLGGVYFAFSAFIVTAMNSINRVILRSCQNGVTPHLLAKGVKPAPKVRLLPVKQN
jgi:hypothetical protein